MRSTVRSAALLPQCRAVTSLNTDRGWSRVRCDDRDGHPGMHHHDEVTGFQDGLPVEVGVAWPRRFPAAAVRISDAFAHLLRHRR